MIRALLFDLDGTIADTDPLHYRAWADSLAAQGLRIDEDFYRRRISGRLNPDIVADVLPQLPADQAEAFVNGKEAAFRALATGLSALPGLAALLAWAGGQGIPVALVTNAPGENARMVLRALGIHGVFRAVVLAEELPNGKPHPDPYLRALELLSVPGAEALAFEDSPSGVRSAVAAGIPTVGLSTGHDEAALGEAGAELIVADFREERLWARLGVAAPTV